MKPTLHLPALMFCVTAVLSSCASSPQPDLVHVLDGKREVTVLIHHEQPSVVFSVIQNVLKGAASLFPTL